MNFLARLMRAIFIFAFYATVVVSCALLLTAAQQRAPAGATFDTWHAKYHSVIMQQANLKVQDEGLKEAREKSRNDLQSNQSIITQCLALYDPTTHQLIPSQDVKDAQEHFNQLRAANQSLRIDELGYPDLCVSHSYSWLKGQETLNDTALKQNVNEVVENQKQLGVLNDRLAKLQDGHDDFVGLEENGLMLPIVSLPYDLLILLLVVTMGAIGGMVRVLRDYGSKTSDNPNPQDYFVIPMIGAVVAIGGYILAKTGLLVLSSSRDQASVSPFTISLVGIVSGLLAKEVIDKIAESGRNMLKAKPDAGGNDAAQPPADAPPKPEAAPGAGAPAGG